MRYRDHNNWVGTYRRLRGVKRNENITRTLHRPAAVVLKFLFASRRDRAGCENAIQYLVSFVALQCDLSDGRQPADWCEPSHDYICAVPQCGPALPVRVGTNFCSILFCFALFYLAYIAAPLVAVCVLPLNQEFTPRASDDAGVPKIFMFFMFISFQFLPPSQAWRGEQRAPGSLFLILSFFVFYRSAHPRGVHKISVYLFKVC